MADTDALFKNRRARPEKLLDFGFAQTGAAYKYSVGLVGGQFELTIIVGGDGDVSTTLVDVAFNESYVLHRVAGARGAFVGAVRGEYEAVLTAVAENCFELNVFKSETAGRVIDYALEKYGDSLQYLWSRFPENAVLRRRDNAKWYAVFLVLQRRKLGLDEEGAADIIDLRGRPEDVAALVDGRKYFPGYHMNKKHWYTIILDGSVPAEELCRRLDESFALAFRF